MSETKQCCKARMDGYHIVGCRKPATVERDGRHYCTIHDPVRVAEKDKARSEKWEARMVEQRKVHALHAAAPDLLAYAVLEQEIADFDCPHDAEARCDCGSRHNAMIARAEKMREAAIQKAEGGR